MSDLDLRTILIAAVVLIVLLGLLGAWIDIAYLGLMPRLWGYGSSRGRPRKGEEVVLRHRFGKLGPLVGWIFSPYEVVITPRRLLVNYRNAFGRLDIPLESIRAVSVKRRPWPMVDDILIGYDAHGTPKQFLLPDKATPIVEALRQAGAEFE